MRKEGRIYLQEGSQNYMCSYSLRGVKHRESTHTSDEDEAQKFLRNRLREVGADIIGAKRFTTPQSRKLTVHDLLDSLKDNFELEEKLSPQNLSHLNRADKDFGHYIASEMRAQIFRQYKAQRRALGHAKATINRPLQMLRQAFTLALENDELPYAPHIKLFSEKGNVRKGFCTETEFRKIKDALPDYLKDFALFAYCTGMRFSEICSLRWEFVKGDEIELQAEDAKGDGDEENARLIPMAGKDLSGVLERRKAARRVKVGDKVQMASLIFHHNGKPIVDIRKAWQTAALKAGAGKMVCRVCEEECAGKWHCKKPCRYVGRIFHDLRRSAVKNLDAAGNSRDVVMSISGHRTDSTYSRYNITDTKRKRNALVLGQEFRERMAAEEAAEATNVVAMEVSR